MDLRKEARNQMCMVRIPGVCDGNPETTVLAHLNGGGMAMKHSDLLGAWACSSCHSAVDGKDSEARKLYSKDELKLMHLEGMARTQDELIRRGVIKW